MRKFSIDSVIRNTSIAMQSHPVESDDECEKKILMMMMRRFSYIMTRVAMMFIVSQMLNVSVPMMVTVKGILHIMSSKILIGLTLVVVKILLIISVVLLTQHRLVQLIWKLVVHLTI
jgi:hypothetical protein